MMTDKPIIEPVVNGPFLVKNLRDFRNSRGDTIETKPVMALCRCGASKNKPFCNGAHWDINFRDDKN